MHQALLRHRKLVAILRVVSCGLLLFMIKNGKAETIDVVPKWKKGQTLRYELIKSRTRTDKGKVTIKNGSTRDLTIKVEAVTDDGYLIHWTTSKSKLEGAAPKLDPAQGEFGALLKDFRMEIELNKDVTFKGIGNWKEVRQSILDALDGLEKIAQKQGHDAGKMEKVRPILSKIFGTKEQVELICAREAQLFFMPLGGSFDAEKPRTYDDLVPNPFGGDPFPAKGSLAVKSADKKGDVTVLWKQSLDPQKATEIMTKTMADFAERIGKPIPKGELIKTMFIDDECEFKLDLRTGWVRELAHTRTTKTGPGGQVDSLKIRRKT